MTTPLERWCDAVKHEGPPRPWPTDRASHVRLEHLRLIDGGIYKRHHSHYRFRGRKIIPTSAGIAAEFVRILYDPREDPLQRVALYSAEGRVNGVYLGDGVVAGIMSAWRPPSDEDDTETGRVRIDRVVDRYTMAAKRRKPREAARQQRQIDQGARQARAPARGPDEEPIRLLRRRGS